MSNDIEVSRQISAPADQVWAMVTDVTRMSEWSPENAGAAWLGGATGPAVGARFRGENRHGSKSWKTVAQITELDPGRRFAFTVKAGPFAVADWAYGFESTADGCTVTETWNDRRNGLLKVMSQRVTGVGDRVAHNRQGMEETLSRLAGAAEGTAARP